MTESEIEQYIGFLIGSFAIGYISAMLIQYFKKLAGIVR